jgi:hypothetical protein
VVAAVEVIEYLENPREIHAQAGSSSEARWLDFRTTPNHLSLLTLLTLIATDSR